MVSDPETGEVLTLANLERDAAGAIRNTGNNLAVTANFEPGSVNKVFTMSAALEEGVVAPDTTLSVPDHLRVADHTFTDSHSHPTEDYTATRIMAESSNIGTIKIAQQLGEDKLDEYLRRVGFGEKTALGLPHDIASYPRAPAYLAAYVQGPWPHTIPAIRGPVDVIFGAEPEGRLPVAIPGRFRFGAGSMPWALRMFSTVVSLVW